MVHATLESALDGVDILLLVSTGHVPNRVRQHKAVIDAAERTGVERIVYTSVLQADKSKMGLAADHLATEQLLAAAPLHSTLLRDSWYLQLYTEDLPGTIKRGMTIGSAGDGPVSALLAAGLTEDDADMIVDSDQAIPRGELETASHDLSRLLRRPTKSVTEFLTDRLHSDGQ